MKVLYYASGIGMALWCILLLAPSEVHAQTLGTSDGPTVFSDDFSSGTLEKWVDIRSDPQGTWRVVDGQAEAVISTGSTLAELVPKDEYWSENWRDLRYELDYTPLQGIDFNISWNVRSPSEWYEIHFVGEGWELARVLPESMPWVLSGVGSLEAGQTVHLVVETNGNRVRIFKEGEQLLDEVDPSFDARYGKIGLKAGAGATAPTRVRFDNVKVTLLNAPEPPPTPTAPPSPSIVPPIPDSPPAPTSLVPLKQSDQRWASATYDHARRWSSPQPPTIERWGCALTSLTMIFHYHGLTHLPTGEPLTPASMNSWLIDQPDGYIGEGLLNWAAAMRLSRLISDQFHTVKLEYRSQPTNSSVSKAEQLAVARGQISVNKPVILQIPGHFFVGDQLLKNGDAFVEDDVHIADPAYAHTTASQHEVGILSTRMFTPSHTDLSYLIIATDPDVHLSLKDSNGMELAPEYTTAQLLTDPTSLESTNQYQVLELPQPATGQYRLELSAPPLTTHGVQIFTYDIEATAQDLSKEVILGSQPTIFTINYHKKGESSTIHTSFSLDSLLADLRHFAQQRASKRYAIRTLVRLTSAAQKAKPDLLPLYTRAFEHYLEWYKPQLEPHFFEYLKHHLLLL